jgi:hypothetical protein
VTGAFAANIHHCIAADGLDLVHFGKGEPKDDIARRYLAEAAGAGGRITERILFVGRAQEKALVFWTHKRRNPVTGTSYAWPVRGPVIVNHFYFYGFDGSADRREPVTRSRGWLPGPHCLSPRCPAGVHASACSVSESAESCSRRCRGRPKPWP